MTTNERSQIPETTVATWKIDSEASRIEFTARMRMMILMNVNVLGHFKDVRGTLTLDGHEPTNSHISVTIGTASLDTNVAERDRHLRSADFFEVERYPTMTFTSRRIELLDRAAGHYRVIGDLTIRDVTREVSLDAWHISPQAAGDSRLACSLTTVLDRRDFGLTWSRPIQRIAEKVDISLSIQLIPASSAM